MARFVAQGRLKVLLNGDGMSEPQRELSHSHYHTKIVGLGLGGLRGGRTRSIQPHYKRNKLKFGGSRFGRVSLYRRPAGCLEACLSARENGIFDEDDLSDFQTDELSCFRGLVLDISYRPVNVVCWKRAICLEFMEKVRDDLSTIKCLNTIADVLEYYDQTVNSPTGSFNIPAVLRVPHLLQVVKRRRVRNTLSRKNIFYRDSFTCQYCFSHENLTIDHVLPTARGGEWKWENLVTACAKCNSRKGQKTLEEANMKLLKVPKAPKEYDILAIPLTSTAIKMLKMRKGTPEEWRQYLPKPSSEP
ncbi:HNH endonuclease 5 [Dillenia turbinata]|uniref:HNH endonuclease 5 n=1 Tax=Dillenia turbinata TaxID=194707 RepID=A0AAN8ZPL2_9MAGN